MEAEGENAESRKNGFVCGGKEMDPRLLEKLSAITPEEEAILRGENQVQKDIYSDSEDFTIESRKMIGEDLVRLRCHTRFVEFPQHTHDYIEMIYMCTGQTRHVINGTTPVTLRAGEILILNQHASHAIHAAGKEDLAVNFFMKPAFLDVALDLLEEESALSRFVMNSLRSRNPEADFLVFHVADVPQVQNLMENLIWSIWDRRPHRVHTDQLTMGLLFLHLLEHTERIAHGKADAYRNAILLRTLRYLEEHYENASLTALAKRLNQPVSQLSRLIKAGTGKTFQDLLMQQRFSRAEFLLLHSDLSVSDIISAVGYSNTSYFYRTFRQKYGVSPREYRQQKRAPQRSSLANEDVF